MLSQTKGAQAVLEAGLKGSSTRTHFWNDRHVCAAGGPGEGEGLVFLICKMG